MKGAPERKFVEAMAAVMADRGATLDKPMPKGFWPAVGELTGKSSGSARAYWKRNEAALLPQLKALIDKVDNVDHEPEPTAEASNVDTVDIPEEPTCAVKDDKVDQTEALPSQDKVDNVGDYDMVVKVVRSEIQSMLENLEAKLAGTMEQRIREAVGGAGKRDKVDHVDNADNLDKVDVPPLPPKDAPNPQTGEKSGRKFRGSKSDLRVRIDSELSKLVEADATEHFSGNLSRCLDAILWRYYGRPLLSFQIENQEET